MNTYLSYLMGADKISDQELTDLGIFIQETRESGSRKLQIPISAIEQYKDLICNKLNAGFWNETVGSDGIFFIFKFKDGTIKQFTLDVNNEHEIDKLCASFNNEPADKTANVYKYLSENAFYHDLMIQHYSELINR